MTLRSKVSKLTAGEKIEVCRPLRLAPERKSNEASSAEAPRTPAAERREKKLRRHQQRNHGSSNNNNIRNVKVAEPEHGDGGLVVRNPTSNGVMVALTVPELGENLARVPPILYREAPRVNLYVSRLRALRKKRLEKFVFRSKATRRCPTRPGGSLNEQASRQRLSAVILSSAVPSKLRAIHFLEYFLISISYLRPVDAVPCDLPSPPLPPLSSGRLVLQAHQPRGCHHKDGVPRPFRAEDVENVVLWVTVLTEDYGSE